MMKKTNISPCRSWNCRAYARNVRFTALIISSMDMKMVMPFLRVSTPITPMVKRMALRIRK
jgi:hypothetical protein